MVALSYYCTKPAQKCLGFGLNGSVGESPHQHPRGQHPAPSPQAEAPVGTVLLRWSPHIPPAPAPGPGPATQGTSGVCPGGCGTNHGGADPLARGGTWGLLHSVGLLRGSLWVLGSLLGGHLWVLPVGSAER